MDQNYRKVVYVVGAGASKEFNLPTGRELLDKISNLVRRESTADGSRIVFSDRSLEAAFHDVGKGSNPLTGRPNVEELLDAALWLCKTCRLAPSIDNLLHAHSERPERVTAGKMLLTHAIHLSEKDSSLYSNGLADFRDFLLNRFVPRGRRDVATLEPTRSWLAELFWILVENRGLDDFCAALSSITFITFNYDRCIEHFIANAASLYFDLDEKEVRRVADLIDVVHPYGSLGSLEVRGAALFGYGHMAEPLPTIASGVRTFTEGEESTDVSRRIHSAISEAATLCFLGFGYLDLNLELLFKNGTYGVPTLIGTCYGLSENSKGVVREFLAKRAKYGNKTQAFRDQVLAGTDYKNDSHLVDIELSSLTCLELLQKHRQLLRPVQSPT